MLSLQDIKARNVIVVNALEQRKFNIVMGNIAISDAESGEVLTKLSCYKVLAIFVIGHMTITTQVLENLNKFGINLVLLKPNFRPFFSFGGFAEANYLLREKQYKNSNNLEIAQLILKNKIYNQINALNNLRNKNDVTKNAIHKCEVLASRFTNLTSPNLADLMGIEGNVAKIYFTAFFDFDDWTGRRPRAKLDPYNVTLDIGYTMLFNFIECFLKLFGFDVYYGVCHTSWFKRKSLVCDLVEPFRPIIDWQLRKAWNLKQFSAKHFEIKRGQYLLKKEYNKEYSQVFFSELIIHKETIFEYIRGYYRAFMGRKSALNYPVFNFTSGEIDYVDSQL